MLPSEIENHFRNWRHNEARVYYYKRHLYNKDIVVLCKVDDDAFESLKDCSTFCFPILSQEKISLLLAKKELDYVSEMFYYQNAKDLITGGCNCGGWISDGHYWWCNKSNSWDNT